ncbi:hypothetical protein [Nocardia brevicatena]|uniref:hypothetical protein n=1 Tax=Nocardia brevicatena TaxID=37327 RepID=UPI000315C114
MRDDITGDDVVALPAGTTQGAVRGVRDPHRRQRVLSIVFAGLAAPATPVRTPPPTPVRTGPGIPMPVGGECLDMHGPRPQDQPGTVTDNGCCL